MSTDAIFKEFPQIETNNLVLREMELSDAEAIFQIYADNDVTKYIDLETATDLAQAKFLVNRRVELFRSGQRIRWGIAKKDDNIIIGSCGFTQWDKNFYRAVIGYEQLMINKIVMLGRSLICEQKRSLLGRVYPCDS